MNYSPTAYMAFAGRAADSFLTDGLPPDDAIAKIATEQDLSRVQIQRVVELTNHELNDRLMKTARDKTFRFPVASTDGVLAKLGTPTADGPSELEIRKAAGAFVGADAEPVVKLADLTEPEEIRRLRTTRATQSLAKIAGWVRTHRTALAAEQSGLHEDIRREMDKLAQLIKDHVAGRGTLADLHKFACVYDPKSKRVWDVLFEAARTQVVKEAGRTAFGARLANERLPASAFQPGTTVINGNHRLQIHLDTLRNKISAEDETAHKIRLLDTHGPAVTAQIRKLRGSADVSRYVVEELHKHADEIADRGYCLRHIEKIAAGGLLASAGRFALKHPGLAAAGVGTALGAGQVLSGAAAGMGRKATAATRDWRPGAYRGVAEGAEI